MRITRFIFAILFILNSFPSYADSYAWDTNRILNANDVDQSNDPIDGQVLVWDDVENKWIFEDQSGGGATVYVDSVEITDPNFVSTGDTVFNVDGSDISADVKGITITGESTVDTITMNTSLAEPADVQGLMHWNADEDTLTLHHANGVEQEIGLEHYKNVQNNTGATITDGTPVMFAGTVGASGRLLGQKAIADGSLQSEYTIGVATEDILNGGYGKVTTDGKVRGIQTDGANYGESWSDDDLIYVSPDTAGYLTNVQPSAPDRTILVAVVVNAHASNGTLEVRPTWTPKLVDLDDVNGTPLTTTGQIPVWDNSNSYFDFDYNITDYYSMSGSTGDTLYFSTADTLVNNSDVKYDATNLVLKKGNVNVTDVGSGSGVGANQILHYKLNETTGTVVDDSSVTNKDGTVTTDASNLTSTGKISNSYDFNASSNLIYNTDIITDMSALTTGTVACWFSFQNTAGDNAIWSLSNDSSATLTEITVDINGQDLLIFCFVDGVVQWYWNTTGNYLTPYIGVFAHLAIKHNGTTPSFWFNNTDITSTGTWVTQTDKTVWFKGVITDASADADVLTVGATQRGSADTYYYDGKIDDFRVYDTSLPTDQLTDLYNSGAGTEDDSATAGKLALQYGLAVTNGTDNFEADNITAEGTDKGWLGVSGKAEIQGESYMKSDVNIYQDDTYLTLGAAEDVGISFDGTDMVFDSQLVGTGDFYFNNGKVGFLAAPLLTMHNHGSTGLNITTVSDATYDLATGDTVLHVTRTSTGTCAIDLKTAQTISDRFIFIKDAGGNAYTNNITVTTEGSETIDGATQDTLEQDNEWRIYYSDGSNWFTMG